MSDPRYTISPDGNSITCSRCGLTSHNSNDVAQRYCGRCKIFHDDPPPLGMVIDDDETTPAAEFDCIECGRHIISLCGPPGERLCAACIHLPGWYDNPQIARILDPDGDARPPARRLQ